MSTIPILADASSRLHADIAIVRLVRAGIAIGQISAVFPRERRPNSAACWLKDLNLELASAAGFRLGAAGPLMRNLTAGREGWPAESDVELGDGAKLIARVCERIERRSIVLCVHARTESEAAIAWHVFLHVGADDIVSATEDFVHFPSQLSAPDSRPAEIAA